MWNFCRSSWWFVQWYYSLWLSFTLYHILNGNKTHFRLRWISGHWRDFSTHSGGNCKTQSRSSLNDTSPTELSRILLQWMKDWKCLPFPVYLSNHILEFCYLFWVLKFQILGDQDWNDDTNPQRHFVRRKIDSITKIVNMGVVMLYFNSLDSQSSKVKRIEALINLRLADVWAFGWALACSRCCRMGSDLLFKSSKDVVVAEKCHASSIWM